MNAGSAVKTSNGQFVRLVAQNDAQ